MCKLHAGNWFREGALSVGKLIEERTPYLSTALSLSIFKEFTPPFSFGCEKFWPCSVNALFFILDDCKSSRDAFLIKVYSQDAIYKKFVWEKAAVNEVSSFECKQIHPGWQGKYGPSWWKGEHISFWLLISSTVLLISPIVCVTDFRSR